MRLVQAESVLKPLGFRESTDLYSRGNIVHVLLAARKVQRVKSTKRLKRSDDEAAT